MSEVGGMGRSGGAEERRSGGVMLSLSLPSSLFSLLSLG
jgi:hypothetical protein